jgi:hypothetical protein
VARTELHRARQKAAVDIYKANDIHKVRWIGIADGRLCSKCAAEHDKVYELKDIEDRLPPLHPRCRCRVVPFPIRFSVTVKHGKRGKVMTTRIAPNPIDYKYVIRLKKSEDLEKGKWIQVPASYRRRAYRRFDPRAKRYPGVHPSIPLTEHQLGSIVYDIKALYPEAIGVSVVGTYARANEPVSPGTSHDVDILIKFPSGVDRIEIEGRNDDSLWNKWRKDKIGVVVDFLKQFGKEEPKYGQHVWRMKEGLPTPEVPLWTKSIIERDPGVSFVLSMEKSRRRVRPRPGTLIPWQIGDKRYWAKVLEKSLLVKMPVRIGDQVMIKGDCIRVTAVGRVGFTARDDKGKKYLIDRREAEVIVPRSLSAQRCGVNDLVQL